MREHYRSKTNLESLVTKLLINVNLSCELLDGSKRVRIKDLWILKQEIPVDWGLADHGQELVGEPNLNSHYANEHFSLKISKMFYFFRIH